MLSFLKKLFCCEFVNQQNTASNELSANAEDQPRQAQAAAPPSDPKIERIVLAANESAAKDDARNGNLKSTGSKNQVIQLKTGNDWEGHTSVTAV